jgi:hypothetical protein
VTDQRYLRMLCWGLVVVAVISAVSQLLLTFNIWAGGPTLPDPQADLVDRLAVFRGNDQEIFGLVLVGGVASLIAFVLVGLIGMVLRAYSTPGSWRDAMTVLLIIGATVGVVSQLLSVGVAQAATQGYCDCGYKTEELIAQDYALSLGFTLFGWFVNVAFVLVGVGLYYAGRLVTISPTWRTLSYAIAALLILSALIRLLAPLVNLPEVAFQAADTVSGLTLAILVPIWAILLTRGGRKMTGVAGAA